MKKARNLKYQKVTEAVRLCCCGSRHSDKVELHEPSSVGWRWGNGGESRGLSWS